MKNEEKLKGIIEEIMIQETGQTDGLELIIEVFKFYTENNGNIKEWFFNYSRRKILDIIKYRNTEIDNTVNSLKLIFGGDEFNKIERQIFLLRKEYNELIGLYESK